MPSHYIAAGTFADLPDGIDNILNNSLLNNLVHEHSTHNIISRGEIVQPKVCTFTKLIYC